MGIGGLEGSLLIDTRALVPTQPGQSAGREESEP